MTDCFPSQSLDHNPISDLHRISASVFGNRPKFSPEIGRVLGAPHAQRRAPLSFEPDLVVAAEASPERSRQSRWSRFPAATETPVTWSKHPSAPLDSSLDRMRIQNRSPQRRSQDGRLMLDNIYAN